MEKFLSDHKIWIELIVAICAIIFSFWQILINKRLKKLQDYVAISVVPDSKNNKIKLLNTGKINLYLHGFDMPWNSQRFNEPRLISAGTGDTAYYWINPPNVNDGEFKFQLYFKDEFGKKFVSEHGGCSDKIQIEKNKNKISVSEIKVWSYKINKKRWSI